MSGRPHEHPAFYNAVTYTVAITFTVEGGVRHGTADRRANRVAEKLANTAARTVRVAEVSAVAGPSRDGQLTTVERVRFAAANTGQGTYTEPDKLDRYLDPDHERALQSLAADHAAAKQRRGLDQERRQAVRCNNTYAVHTLGPRECACVYCDPEDHYLTVQYADHSEGPFRSARCLCGTPVPAAGQRCLSHRDTAIVVLDGDPPALHVLADQHRRTAARHICQHPAAPEQDLDL
jgi:hypothetical protein